MKYTIEKLLTMPAHELRNLYNNAKRISKDPSNSFYSDAIEFINKIKEFKIIIPSEELKLDSPEGKLMEKIIFSVEGRVAAISAAKAGLSPMRAIDPMLQNALGDAYKGDNGATIQAGYLVANLMRQENWDVKPKQRDQLPEECIAKTAALYVHIPSKR